jgi:hypothetical protein
LKKGTLNGTHSDLFLSADLYVCVLFLFPVLLCGKSCEVNLQIEGLGFEELVCLFSMFRSMLEDLRVRLDPQESNAEVTKQTFEAAMRAWAKKLKENYEMW